jgi:mRNA interferase MazF
MVKMHVSQRDIVLLSYPFSDLAGGKVRPVIVVSNDEYNKKFEDMAVVPLTTNLSFRDYAFIVTSRDLEEGHLIRDSLVKADRIFSIKKSLVRMRVGKVKPEVHRKIIKILIEILE